MAIYNHLSQSVVVFHRLQALGEGDFLAGYSALIQAHSLRVPIPDHLCAIGTKHKKYYHGSWHIFTPRHKPADTLDGHLTFTLKHQGIGLH